MFQRVSLENIHLFNSFYHNALKITWKHGRIFPFFDFSLFFIIILSCAENVCYEGHSEPFGINPRWK